MVCTHTKKVGEMDPGVLPKGVKMCFVFILSPMQCGLLATYPAPISTIFETVVANRCPHVYTGEKFPNFCAEIF